MSMLSSPNSPTMQKSIEPGTNRVKFVTNLYDKEGESYGIFGEYYYQEHNRIAKVLSVKWQFIAKVEPQVVNSKEDVEQFICEDLTARIGKMKEINFEL